MKVVKSTHYQRAFRLTLLLVLVVLSLPHVARAQQNWNATVSGQSKDMSKQLLPFFPTRFGSTPATASPGLSPVATFIQSHF
jgi:ABC-type phosphate/phosphonate transport system permease subunit